MALKKKTSTSKGEHLYMLEIFIDKVNLTPEVTSSVNVEDLVVLINFSDLPQFEISVSNSNPVVCTEGRESAENLNDLKFGKSCLFAKTPSNLIKAIGCTPLFIEVYQKESSSSVNKNGVLLGTAKMSLPECMSQHVSSAQNENDGLSTPCIVKGTFELINPNGKVPATISVVLRLSCFGSSIIKQFSLKDKSFVIEDSPLRKFLCLQKTASTNGEDSKDGTPLLKRPASPPRVTIEDPAAFKRLTTAEQLNDPKFREMVYRAYPDEPTCSCLPTDRSTHPMECRSGCQRSCCMKLRNPEVLATENRTVDDAAANTYCVKDFLSTMFALKQCSPCCGSPRLRGGGDIEQIYLDPVGYKWTDYDTDYPWYDDRNSIETRLEGGGGEEKKSSCSCTAGKVPIPFRKTPSKEREIGAILDACKPRVVSTGPQPGCSCPGRDMSSWNKGAAKCSKKPCMGIDCLIRAFKEAQEFVDSIGKVPGLPGLGLMDPSESPYFGRDIDKDYVPQKPQEEKKKAGPGAHSTLTGPPPAPPCTAPCSKGFDDVHSAPMSLPYSVPPRLGIVREAIPVLPEAGSVAHTRHRKKEDKKDDKSDKQKELDATVSALTDTDMGPCGEPKCKSKRKKPIDNTSTTQSATQLSSKTRGDGPKRKRSKEKKNRGKSRSSRNASSTRGGSPRPQGDSKFGKVGGKDRLGKPGPGGDRSSSAKPAIPVSRQVMRYVYFVGDSYPGIYYGHKNCIDIPMRVPANMGWLWNTVSTAGNLKPRIGWRPGAIGRYLYEMLQEAKENSMAAVDESSGSKLPDRPGKTGRTVIERARSAPSRSRTPTKRRGDKAMRYASMKKTQSKMEGEEEGGDAPPTLHIHRKDGTYYVTMYPIRAETTDEPRLSEPMKPLQFKIVKNKDDASEASSSTASDMEIEFSPPAAVSRYRKKPDVVHVDTQVRQQQILDAMKAEPAKKDRKGRRDRSEPEKKAEKVQKPEKKVEKQKKC
ncbi:uncharacterized protein LOC143179576 [Calliopsis andreniformis]|uniref:uncharacterized protein LOC143179576 n=1 Tax=Calliopsis andreniformis TaxID=337506 RepID=UPI003FCDE5DA